MLVSAPEQTSHRATDPQSVRSWRTTPVWNRFTPLQLLVMGAATIPLVVIPAALLVGASGIASVESVQTVVLGAGEDPGMVVFGAMFLASPMQWWTRRSQVRVRKYLGIVFFALALSNGAMFLWQEGAGQLLSRLLVIAGLVSLLLATPLFLTSSRASQRLLGMRRWRLLHKLTYVVAAGLVAHVLLIGDGGPGLIMILLGFAVRLPPVRRWISTRHDRVRPNTIVTF